MQIIEAPISLKISSCAEFVTHINKLSKADEYIFDFRKTRNVQPFSLLYLSSEIARFSTKHSNAIVTVTNHEHMDYAGHMGFFQAFRIDFGRMPGEAYGNSNYIPIKLFSCADIISKAQEEFKREGELVEQLSEELAKVLCQNDAGSIFEALTYALREIIRNVVEHSESSQFGICAQHWPSTKIVQAAILDRGIGIRKSLSLNPHLSLSSDIDAINMALLPGVSGKAFKGKKQSKYDVWANSGFGLYMTSRMCRKGGDFFIASGQSGLFLQGVTKREINIPFSGTMIRLVFNTDSIQDLRSSLERFYEEGRSLALKNLNITPSVASQMLSRDFKS